MFYTSKGKRVHATVCSPSGRLETPTCHSDLVRGGAGPSYVVLGFTVIISTVLVSDVSDGEVLTGRFGRIFTLLVPAVVSFGVSVAATAQIHCAALRDVTRGTHRHREKPWSIW